MTVMNHARFDARDFVHAILTFVVLCTQIRTDTHMSILYLLIVDLVTHKFFLLTTKQCLACLHANLLNN